MQTQQSGIVESPLLSTATTLVKLDFCRDYLSANALRTISRKGVFLMPEVEIKCKKANLQDSNNLEDLSKELPKTGKIRQLKKSIQNQKSCQPKAIMPTNRENCVFEDSESFIEECHAPVALKPSHHQAIRFSFRGKGSNKYQPSFTKKSIIGHNLYLRPR